MGACFLGQRGLIVQQEDTGVAYRRSGCNSQWVHFQRQSRGPTATTLGSHPGDDGSIPSGTIGGRAQVRQSEERSGLNPDVCRFDSCSGYCSNLSSWSSQECSLACHARGRRFKSDRGRWVRLPLVPLQGWWSSRLPVKQLSENKRGGRREVRFLHHPYDTARSSSGRTQGSQPCGAGSIPARVTSTISQVVELVDTRHSDRRAPAACEFDSRLGYFRWEHNCG